MQAEPGTAEDNETQSQAQHAEREADDLEHDTEAHQGFLVWVLHK